MWLMQEGFIFIVIKIWSKDIKGFKMQLVIFKLKFLKFELLKFNKEKFGEIEK